MALRLIQAPANPVSLALAKAHLRVDHDAEDELIALYMDAALAHLNGPDGVLGRAVSTQTWELVMDAFPDGPIELPLPPLQSVAFIRYWDEAGEQQTVQPTDYAVDADSEPGWVVPANAWPATLQTPGCVVIRFTCGYGTTPAPLRDAILLRTASSYANREVMSDRVLTRNRDYEHMIFPFRLVLP